MFRRHGAAFILLGLLALGACAPRTVRVIEIRDHEADVRFFERIVEEDPENTYARQQLVEARRRLAHDLSIEARVAMDRRRYAEAHRLAQRAAEYDGRHVHLVRETGRRLAHAYLAESEGALAANDFARARSRVRDAEHALPDYAPTARLRDRINLREATFFAELAEAYYRDGDQRSAMHAVERAMELDPTNASIVRLRSDITRASRANWAQGRTDDLLHLITVGRLDEAEVLLERLRAAEGDTPDVESFARRIDDQRDEARISMREADEAMNEGRFEDAVQMLLLAAELDGSIDIAPLLAESQAGRMRNAMLAAMDAGDARGALLAAREVLRFAHDPQTERFLPQLESAFVQSTLREAAALQREGKIDEARERIREAISVHDVAQFHEFLAQLRRQE